MVVVPLPASGPPEAIVTEPLLVRLWGRQLLQRIFIEGRYGTEICVSGEGISVLVADEAVEPRRHVAAIPLTGPSVFGV